VQTFIFFAVNLDNVLFKVWIALDFQTIAKLTLIVDRCQLIASFCIKTSITLLNTKVYSAKKADSRGASPVRLQKNKHSASCGKL